ncbi:hypothetical protein [Pseudomonas sp. CF161]|uniref:hypothetical protein n=1 Tax=Pseudomonas sp. CF161 TaxID=911241 RepID=UPI00035515C4|nr:hypothetical protein [Pseudomonas sp. CF161]EPL15579.1 hypothetical protein CF161_03066 [Pseudomonas sp. CF161]
MTAVDLSQGAQKLKVYRTVDGQTAGCLQCSVVVDFGAVVTWVFEESLPNVPVSYVLNPQGGIFFADEVQRLMRLGIARWLALEVSAERVVGCRKATDGGWEVLFRLPGLDGGDCELHVSVDAATATELVQMRALKRVNAWIEQQAAHPLDEELSAVLAEIDLQRAPNLRRGFALSNPAPQACVTT